MSDGVTLPGVLQRWAEIRPDHIAFRFLRSDESVAAELSFATLWERSLRVAGALGERAPAGSRALLLFETEPAFVEAFVGCLAARVLPVPADPPHGRRAWRGIERMVADCAPATVLTTSTLRQRWATQMDALGAQTSVVVLDELDRPPGVAAAPSGSSLAFLQYTSGSTSRPKGVMVTHDNVIANVRMIQEAFELDGDTRTVSWLPLFHDMGLIGFVLVPIYLGCTSTILSPAAFLEQPVRWLRTISRYRGTISSAPNFAYELCAEKVPPEDESSLDLSSWECALNGSEPVSARTLSRFRERFSARGFRPTAFRPCYGMAETTLLASAITPGASVRLLTPAARDATLTDASFAVETRDVVGCGHARRGGEIRIVEPTTRTLCEDGQVGEVWLRGDHVAAGYWHRDEETAETFGATLAEAPDGPGFLRTGDLGCVDAGELFLMGRIKELVIIRGRNLLPRDVEEAVGECHHALRPGHVVAVGLRGETTERLGIVAEIDRASWRTFDAADLIRAISDVVSGQFGVAVDEVALLRPGSLPKTTSGKLQRVECRRRLEGTADETSWSVLHHWRRPTTQATAASTTPALDESLSEEELTDRLLDWLRARLARAIGCSPDDIADEEPFSSFGLDSAVAVTLTSELSEWLGLELDPTVFWEHTHPLALSEHLAARLVERAGALAVDR